MRGIVKTLMIKLQAYKFWIIALGLVLSAGTAYAASFGKMNVLSSLGQPLLAEIDLVNVTPDDLLGMSAKIASPEMFREANVDLSPALETVKLAIERRDNGQPYIRVVSAQPISLASLNLLVEVNWASGRLVRDYPVLLNPANSVASAVGAGSVSPPGFVNQAPAVSAETKEKESQTASTEPTKAATPPIQVAATPKSSPTPPPSSATSVSKAESSREEPSPPPAQPAAAKTVERANDNEKSSKADEGSPKPRKVVKVKSGDTLTSIAAKLSPSKGMLEQTMIAVFEANRQAFIKDNVNLIRSGTSLNIPDSAEAAAIPAEEASKRLKLMAKDFDAYRNRLASAAAARPVVAASKAPITGKMEGATDDAAAAVKPGNNDVLKLSRSAEKKKTDLAARGDQAKTDQAKPNSATEDKLREEAIVRDNQLKEARERAAILEKDVGQMRKLLQEKEALARQLEIANAKKAEEQKNAAAKGMSPPVAIPQVLKPEITEEQKEAARKESQQIRDSQAKKEPETKVQGEDAAKGTDKVSSSKLGEPASKIKGTDEGAEKESKPVNEEKKDADKEPEKAVAPLGRPDKKPESTEPAIDSSNVLDTLTEHPLAIAGGLASGLLIGWLGLTLLRRRRERLQDALFEPDPIDPISHGVSNTEPAPVIEVPMTSKMVETIKTFNEANANEDIPSGVRQDVDPIEEADVYIAYGRNEQAEEILLKAIVANPARLELIKKLLDLYAMQKRTTDFSQAFNKLQSLAPAGSTLLASARRMGAEIDPANALYSMVAPAAPAPSAATAQVMQAPVPPPVAASAPASMSAVNLDVTTGPAPEGGADFAASPAVSAASVVPPIPGETPSAPASFADIDLDMADQPSDTTPAVRGPEWQAVATQLDLARAYLEIEDKDNARDLLNEVVEKGDAGQRAEAERILAELGG